MGTREQNRILAELRSKMIEIEQGSFSSDSHTAMRMRAFRRCDDSLTEPSTVSGVCEKETSFDGSSAGDAYDENAAMRKIERLCSMREQASKQLFQRLVRDGFSEKVANSAISRALSCGLVDDMRFADVLVRCRVAAGKGCAGIARELSALDIDPLSVDEFVKLSESDESVELDRALALLMRKPPRAKNAREAAYRKLVTKGYSAEISSRASRMWFDAEQLK